MAKRSVLLLLLSLCCQAEQLRPGELITQDLQRALPDYQYRNLEAGEQRFVALFSENTIANRMGVAILVNDHGRSHLGNQSLGPLASHLNDEGWVTLVITAPQGPLQVLPGSEERDNSDAQQGSPAPFESAANTRAEQFDRFTSQLDERIDAARQVARNYPGFVLVVAQGTSAAALLNLYAEQAPDLPDALVTVSPYWPDARRNHALAEKMASLSIPVLDIYYRWNNAWTLDKRQQRLVAAHKALKMHYRQREIIGTELIANQYPYMAKEVQGWLIHMGW